MSDIKYKTEKDIIDRIDQISSELKTLKSVLSQPPKEKKLPYLEVKITGDDKAGKTTLAALIANGLEELGYGRVEYRSAAGPLLNANWNTIDTQRLFEIRKINVADNNTKFSPRKVVVID